MSSQDSSLIIKGENCSTKNEIFSAEELFDEAFNNA